MDNIRKFIARVHAFGLKVPILQALTSITRRMNLPIQHCLRKMVRYNLNLYIENNYREILSKEYKNECKDIIDKDYPIWIFWEQVIEQAPEVVKICVNSIIEHNPERKVNIISRDNLEDYIELPDYIVEKHKCGKISYAHFSDIVRFALLYTWGGVWMDATLYQSGPLNFGSHKIEDYTLFTSKGSYANLGCLFTSFFIACNRGNALACWMRDFYFRYWEKEDEIIDYLLIDVALMAGYDNIAEIREQVDLIPMVDTNENMYRLFYIYRNQKYDDDIFSQLTRTFPLHKFSYKFNLVKKIDGKLTFYGMIYNRYISKQEMDNDL